HAARFVYFDCEENAHRVEDRARSYVRGRMIAAPADFLDRLAAGWSRPAFSLKERPASAPEATLCGINQRVASRDSLPLFFAALRSLQLPIHFALRQSLFFRQDF